MFLCNTCTVPLGELSSCLADGLKQSSVSRSICASGEGQDKGACVETEKLGTIFKQPERCDMA